MTQLEVAIQSAVDARNAAAKMLQHPTSHEDEIALMYAIQRLFEARCLLEVARLGRKSEALNPTSQSDPERRPAGDVLGLD